MTKDKLVIATRGSKLALWQAGWIKSEIEKIEPSLKVELNKIRTTGDRILDVPLAQVGGKGLFVKEIEEAMLRGEADLAVHSMKDVPTELPAGLHLSAICRREDPRDAIITAPAVKSENRNPGVINDINDLPHGARVGTSSLRRICQILNRRPDLRLAHLRGNVDTRIRKLDEGLFDAIILAAAGVKRLGRADRITAILPPESSLPAIGQGAIGIECRVDDVFTNDLLRSLNHDETSICIRAERAFLERLEGGCQVPIAAYARLERGRPGAESGTLFIEGLVGSLDGKTIIRDSFRGSPGEAGSVGRALAEKLLSRGAGKILDEVYGQNR